MTTGDDGLGGFIDFMCPSAISFAFMSTLTLFYFIFQFLLEIEKPDKKTC